MRHYTAYIDEAGDDGFSMLGTGLPTGQSQWLVLGALIVSRDNDLKLPAWRNAIRDRFPRKQTPDLHFRDLKHEQRVVVCQEIGVMPIGLCLAFSNKATLPGSPWENTFRQKGYLYNFLIRWLLERVTTAVASAAGSEGACLRVVFSRRKGMNYQDMRDYLILMRDGRELMSPVRSINWAVLDIDNIAVENHAKWAGLQLADCATSAFFSAVEPNQYSNYESRYALLLKNRLIRDSRGVLNCGLILVPSLRASQPNDHQRAFFTECSKRGEQAPGP